ncbi:hypothetical protein N7471_009178 [Penicillium samsonianum]|uniref:uncharacterized protein n=1 Tax=Penicillium samsonianum TaxID=1882272 RepID=UPI0025493AD5|nr:uncharacterized protein N7471_009178 [Penicillium samsonianum]KAJ6127961.1 hypothetical protein N7471_009178 [Penicillium samsonianum]
MEVLPAANLEIRVQHRETAEILEHEFTVVASILEDHSGPELATNRERDLANELQEHAAEEVANNAEKSSEVEFPKEDKNLIRELVFDCWMFCGGRIDAWNWKSEDIWNAFKEFRGNNPIYEMSKSFRTTSQQALDFRPPSWGASRP